MMMDRFQPRLGEAINSKLGYLIHTWSLPAGREGSCPGSTPVCEKYCYAKTQHFTYSATQRRFRNNQEFSRSREFVPWMIAALAHAFARVVRIHTSGDFYDAAYVRRWIRIAKACPRVTFFGYTRSWRVPAIQRELRVLAKLPNVHLWWSEDRDTGPSPRARGIRRAFMTVSDVDLPRPSGHLVFRAGNRRPVLKKLNDVLVCPHENGTHIPVTCSSCKICWTESRDTKKENGQRRSLPLVLV